MKKHITASAGLACLALTFTLASCSEPTAAQAPSPGGDGQLEKTQLTVGVLPLADYAAVYWADDHGFFEKVGLSVEVQPLQGGPIGVQKVASGELDFSFANSISTAIATAGGAPVTTVVSSSSLGPHSNLIFVKQDSPIEDLEDLAGKTVGVNTTNNIGDVTFKNLASSMHLDIKPNWVEVPFNEIAAGVQADSIDAGYLPEPFASAARESGLREVVDLTQGPNAELTAATFVASDSFVEKNPKTVVAFVDAMYAAGNDIAAKEAEFREWLPGVAGVTPEVAAEMALPVFESEMKVEKLQAVTDMLVEQGIIKESDVSQHTYLK